MDILRLPRVTLERIMAESIGLVTIGISGVTSYVKHALHYLTSDGKHYKTSDGLYYQVKES